MTTGDFAWKRWRVIRRHSAPSAEEHRTLSLDEVRKRLGSEGGDQFVVGAEQGGPLIGTAGFYREQNLKTRHQGRIWGVYMTPARRGTEVGKRMLQTILKRMEEMEGLEQVLLSVAATQTAAFRLYVRQDSSSSVANRER